MANFDLVKLALKATCPGNDILLDDKGLPSVMVYVPKFKMSDVITGGSDSTAPMFIINGQEVPGLYLSKYQNVIHNGRAYSLPGEDPANHLTWDTARQACEAKGRGWHMMTKAEYAAIALWCKKNGYLPYGNNDYGKDSRETLAVAIPAAFSTDTPPKVTRVLTGTGPVTWSHNKAVDGIWDINGNVSEWTGGIRTVYGELQLLANNNAADSNNPQSTDAATWKAIDAATGDFVDPNGTGTVKVDKVNNKPQYRTVVETQSDSFNSAISDVTCDATIGDAAKAVLIAYGLLADDSGFNYEGDVLYFNNVAAERLFVSGGGCTVATRAGVFYATGTHYSRTNADTNIGFRSAYVAL
ncbi:MAG: SUMF1/EgtB/PvdO family nonheme iron enzyme [Peptococcaceae bacterium]|nr:SUMF1/EgtB/PvdO family nonheme iron enzyme [Candidatus Syntrophopropionicum ammoniitolerans]